VTRKQAIAGAFAAMVVVSLSALLAYRLGLRHSGFARDDAKEDCVDFREAQSRAGESTCVSGRIVRAFTSRGGNSFLDFCPDYHNCPFGAVIFSPDRNKFGDLDTLAGRRVEIQGSITVYQGRAEIIVHGPQQIKVLP
jgi:hypothetical protein